MGRSCLRGLLLPLTFSFIFLSACQLSSGLNNASLAEAIEDVKSNLETEGDGNNGNDSGGDDAGGDDGIFNLFSDGTVTADIQAFYNDKPCVGEQEIQLRFVDKQGQPHFEPQPDQTFAFYTYDYESVPSDCTSLLDESPAGTLCATYFNYLTTHSVENYFLEVVDDMPSDKLLFAFFSANEVADDEYHVAISPGIEAMEFGQCNNSGSEPVIEGTLRKWYPLTFTFSHTDDGDDPVDHHENDPEAGIGPGNFNPFKDYLMVVTFSHPASGTSYDVHGYFDGDGLGGNTGNKWRAKFHADKQGSWNYSVTFLRAIDIVGDIGTSSTNGTQLTPLHGSQGTFDIGPTDPDAPGFIKKGRLEYVGKKYMKFKEGEYFIKTGIDSPENLFGYGGFDNTKDDGGHHGMADGVHRYNAHVSDWNPGDPYWRAHPETSVSCSDDGDTVYCCPQHGEPDNRCNSKGIIGLINYMSEKHITSFYFLPMNLGGDGKETYPFIKIHDNDYNERHYDISKLRQWTITLEHAQNKEVMPHFLLAETESGNENFFDNGTLGIERKIFYREIVARFGHLLAAKYNIGEETDYSNSNLAKFAEFLTEVYPYKDKMYLAFHTHWIGSSDEFPMTGNNIGEYGKYQQMKGNEHLTSFSFQGHPANAASFMKHWYDEMNESGWDHDWVMDFDEMGKASEGLNPSAPDVGDDDNLTSRRKYAAWDILLNNGHYEWYFGGGDHDTESLISREDMWNWQWYARRLLQGYNEGGTNWAGVPYWNMRNANEWLNGETIDNQYYQGPEVFCIRDNANNRCQDHIVIYYPQPWEESSGTYKTGRLTLENGTYEKRWYSPRSGSLQSPTTHTISGTSGTLTIGDAPSPVPKESKDWVVVIQKI